MPTVPPSTASDRNTRPSRGPDLFAMSVGQRLGVVAVVIAIVWGAVAWAL